jgi:hypothetical protein
MTTTPPKTGLSFETTLVASDVRQAISRSFFRRYMVVGLIAFAAVTLFRLQRPWRDNWNLITDLLSYVVGLAIGILGLGFAALLLSSRETARRSEASGPTTYHVTEDGIEILVQNGTAQVKWGAFAGFSLPGSVQDI